MIVQSLMYHEDSPLDEIQKSANTVQQNSEIESEEESKYEYYEES